MLQEKRSKNKVERKIRLHVSEIEGNFLLNLLFFSWVKDMFQCGRSN